MAAVAAPAINEAPIDSSPIVAAAPQATVVEEVSTEPVISPTLESRPAKQAKVTKQAAPKTLIKATPEVETKTEPVKREPQHTIRQVPPGFGDPMDPVIPIPIAERQGLLPEKISPIIEKLRRARALKAGPPKGQAISVVMTASLSTKIDEVSVSVDMVIAAYMNPKSELRTILAQDPEFDADRFITDRAYAVNEVIDVFEKYTIMGLVEKSPATDEASVHARRVKAHIGPGIRVNPIVFAVWNADFDGDTMKVSFGDSRTQGVKTAMDFLIGTEGTGKIDEGFFAMARWGKDAQEVRDQLADIFGTDKANGGLTAEELTGLSKAIELTWDPDTLSEGFRSMLRWSKRIGERFPDKSRATAHVLDQVQRHNRDIRVMSMTFRGEWNALGIPLAEFDTRLDEAAGLLVEPTKPKLIDPSSPAANMNDYFGSVDAPFGSVEEANQPFRLIGAIGKLVREVQDFIGAKSTNKRDTAEDFLTLAMSGRETLDESTNAIAGQVRMNILNEAGFPPKDPAQFNAWLSRFTDAYNRQVSVVDSVKAEVTLGHTLSPYASLALPRIPTTGEGKAWRQAVRLQFKMVYGGYTMSKLFFGAAPKFYENVTLNEFVYTNKAFGKTLGNQNTPFDTPANFIGRLADMRTSFAFKFNKDLGQSLAKMMSGNQTIFRKEANARAKLGDNRVRFDQDVQYVFDALTLLGPEMFDWLRLDSPDAFSSTKLGMKFIQAKSAQQLGGVLYEAIARYRFSQIELYQTKYNEATDESSKRYYEMMFEYELNEMASSSDTWATIARSFRGQLTGQSGNVNIFKDVLYADLTMDEKNRRLNILVQNDPLGRPHQEPYEVTADLFANPKALYARDRFTTDFGHGELLKAVKAASLKIDNFGKANWTKCVTDVRSARAGTKKGDLKKYLDILAKDTRELIRVEPWMISDAVLAILNKSYRSTEKNKQEGASSVVYSTISTLINGGVWSDLTVGGDFALDSISMEQLQRSPVILAKLLSDPTFSITVFDERGADTILSQEALLGKDPTEDMIWDWMQNHPRAAMALRESTSQNSVDKKTGFSWPTATKSLVQSIKYGSSEGARRRRPNRNALVALADHPGFYALVALTMKVTGNKSAQLRETTTKNVTKVIDFLRSLDPTMDMYDYVREMMVASGWNMDEVDRVYEQGQKQDKSTELKDDVQDTTEYQLGQLYHDVALDLTKYSHLIASLNDGVKVDAMTPTEAAELFHFEDLGTNRTYADAVQTMISAKTQVSTSVNGSESRYKAALMFLAQYKPEPCDAPAPIGISATDFLADWADYQGRNAFIVSDNRWIPIEETSINQIIQLSAGDILIEDPAVCSDPTCPCKRHATADPSTNFGDLQTTALGRMLTIVRTLSTEGLNLKTKTQGNDKTDSITKFRVFDMITGKAEVQVNIANQQGGMPAARLELAKIMKGAFGKMRYDKEMSLDDYVNVAQILIRPITTEDGEIYLKVLSIGQLNSILKFSIGNARAASQTGLEHQQVIAEAVKALNDPAVYDRTLDVETIMAGVNVVSENPFFESKLISQRESSIGRNLELARTIQDEAGFIPADDKALDEYEKKIDRSFPGLFKRWKDWAGVAGRRGPGSDRYSYRIIGYIGVNPETDIKRTKAIGYRNAWVIDAASPMATEAIIQAYELGLTALIDGDASRIKWVDVMARTGAIDESQIVELAPNQTMLPMFDIRLNGGNTTLAEGAFNAGSFHSPSTNLYFYYENPANESSAGDSEFIPTVDFVENLRPNRTGETRLPARVAFANMLWDIRNSGGRGSPYVRLATKEELIEDFLNPYIQETTPGAPVEFDHSISIDPGLDAGVVVVEGSPTDIRIREGVQKYLSRLDEADDRGLLTTEIRPGEVVGWLRAEYNGEVRYHPIRPYETGHEAGAPEKFNLSDVQFDEGTQDVVMRWEYSGTMVGRMFKIFEALYAANKYMARSEAVPSIALDNGVKLSGYIAPQSTQKRRLLMRRQQKMMTLMYMARISPYGYNLAEKTETFSGDPDFKERVLSGDAMIGEWKTKLDEGPIAFFPSTMKDMNDFANLLATKAVRCGINPTNVFGSRFNGVDSEIWFNFQVLFEGGPIYQASLMQFMNYLNPTLCPATLEDTGDTLFNSNLQVQVPIDYTTETGEHIVGKQWVDVFGGFHFLDEHYSGYSAAGATVSTNNLPTLNTLGLGGVPLSAIDTDRYLTWGDIGPVSRSASPNWMMSEVAEDED